MKRIPRAREVDKAIKGAIAATKAVLKSLNALAGQVMAKGRYEDAEALVEKGRDIQAFQVDLASAARRWREIRSNRGQGRSKGRSSPLWAYYQPVLKALLELGGRGTREEIEPIVERLMSLDFQPGDKDVLPRGRQRWKVMIQRSRKHLVAEGWIAGARSKIWSITADGRKAATAVRA